MEIPYLWNVDIRLCTICQQLKMTCPQEAFLWRYRVYSISFNIMTAVLQLKNWPSLLDGIHMILSCNMMCKNLIESCVKSLKTKWRYMRFNKFCHKHLCLFCSFNPCPVQGTVVEGTIQQLFEGHHMNYIECINVDYKSTRKESFYGIYSWCKFELSGVLRNHS